MSAHRRSDFGYDAFAFERRKNFLDFGYDRFRVVFASRMANVTRSVVIRSVRGVILHFRNQFAYRSFLADEFLFYEQFSVLRDAEKRNYFQKRTYETRRG